LAVLAPAIGRFYSGKLRRPSKRGQQASAPRVVHFPAQASPVPADVSAAEDAEQVEDDPPGGVFCEFCLHDQMRPAFRRFR
jgi:hypothetical protein